MSTYTMKFKNPVFFKGNQTTLRKGNIWTHAEIGDLLLLTNEKNEVIDTANVVRTKVCKFNEIKDNDPDMAMEHDPNCKDLEGLLEAMKLAYPEFETTELVTWVEFTVPGAVEF